MVETARAPAGTGALRAINVPQPVTVKANNDGRPAAVRLSGRILPVASVEDHWRVDDEWWRDAPIARSYWEVLLEDGRRVTLFHDHVSGRWYQQRYG